MELLGWFGCQSKVIQFLEMVVLLNLAEGVFELVDPVSIGPWALLLAVDLVEISIMVDTLIVWTLTWTYLTG